MDSLVEIEASSVDEYFSRSLHQYFKPREWIPTGSKSQISLDLLNSSLTLEYSKFSDKSFLNDKLFSPRVKRVRTFLRGLTFEVKTNR